MTCPTCAQPMTIGALLTIGDGQPLDARTAAFEQRVIDRNPDAAGTTWQIAECRNPGCGCGCRRYLPT